MGKTKDDVNALLDRLPDDCTLDEVLYHIYVMREVTLGLKDAAEGNVTSHEEVEAELKSRWHHLNA